MTEEKQFGIISVSISLAEILVVQKQKQISGLASVGTVLPTEEAVM